MTPWWRRNRLWLLAVPFALAAMLVASAYDVRTFWYYSGPHHELAAAEPGDPVEVTDDFSDAVGDTSRTFSVRLDRLEPVDVFPFDDVEGERPPPDGLQAVAAHLDWSAEPDQVLRGCQVALVDDDGRRYELLPGGGQVDVCTPEDAGGPEAPLLEGARRGELPYGEGPRPASWSTAPVLLVPEGRNFTRLLVWWELPDYATLPVS